MVEAAPSAPFIVPEPDLLLELLIVALDAPTQFGGVDQSTEGDSEWKGREPVFGRCGLVLWPLDQQPFLCRGRGVFVPMSNANTYARKARGQPVGRAFPPLDRMPGFRRQTE